MSVMRLITVLIYVLQEDIFDLDTFYVGPLRKISIGHDRLELGKYNPQIDKVFTF